jgi:hypothetical protein
LLVKDLRQLLEKYSDSTVREIVVEMYKKIPKKIKEDNGIDYYLEHIEQAMDKTLKPKVEEIDFDDLSLDVSEFIGNVKAGYYFSPNRVVDKTRRSKWRVEAKRYIKGLLGANEDNAEEASELLLELYETLSTACGYTILVSDNPFQTLGYKQEEFLKVVFEKRFHNGYTQKKIEEACKTIINSYVDRETVYRDLNESLVETLQTDEAREMALDFLSKYKSVSSDEYTRRQKRNYATDLYLMIKLKMNDYDGGISYFLANYQERDPEITMYCLLTYYLRKEDLNSYWLREYESALKRGIDFRNGLKEQYVERKAKAE